MCLNFKQIFFFSLTAINCSEIHWICHFGSTRKKNSLNRSKQTQHLSKQLQQIFFTAVCPFSAVDMRSKRQAKNVKFWCNNKRTFNAENQNVFNDMHSVESYFPNRNFVGPQIVFNCYFLMALRLIQATIEEWIINARESSRSSKYRNSVKLTSGRYLKQTKKNCATIFQCITT